MDIEIPYTDVELVPYVDIEVPSEVSIDSTDSKALDITFDNNEYSIVGDDMVVVTKYDDAPQWLKDTIDNIVNIKTAVAVGNLNTVKEALDVMLGELDIAKNTYQLSIISSDDINQRITTAITSLNSALRDADATILDIANTAVTPSEASAIALNTLSASLSSNGEIGSAIHNLQTAMTTLQGTTAESISYLESTMEGEITGNAQAMHVIRTYVGIDDNGVSNGTGLLSDVAILQKQNDGVIETVTGTYNVMINPKDPNLAELVLTAEPYKRWKAADVTGMDTRLKHIGDVYIKYSVTANGARQYIESYKFIRTIVDASDAHKSTDAEGFTWALIVDQAAQDAYNQALNAYDLADNKRRVFTATPYGPYDIGDLWTKTVSGGSTLYKATVKRVSGYVAGDWVVADDAGLNTFVSTTYTPAVTSLQNQVDGKIESWYTQSTSDPRTAWTDAATRVKHDGDLWYQTNTFLSYWYSSATHSWNLIEDKAARDALENAATAQATADGKISSYYMATLASAQNMSTAWTALEKTNNAGDLVVIYNDATLDNNGTWRWNGTSWETTRDKKLVSLASDVTTLRTDLNSGAGTWVTGDTQVTNNLTAVIEDTKATIESQWKYNSNLTLDGITYSTGFGLATSLTTGSELPTGASEFWVKADKFKLMSADGNRKSAYSPFTVDSTTGNITFNGVVSFSNISNTQGSGTNLLYNSAPKIGNETKGWSIGWSNHGLSSSLNAGFDQWRPTGGASVYVVVPGNPGIGTVFDINNSRFPVVAGVRYEASAYVSSHRCNSWVALAWFDSNGNYINESTGTSNGNASNGPLANWSRSTMFATAPSNAATAQFYVRSSVTSDNPYCFVAYAYAGVASANQTITSNWSEGSSAGVSSSDVVSDINNGLTTTINGGKITTGSITASQIAANSISADRINTIGLIAENISANVLYNKGANESNYSMKIDLVNGELHIR